MNILSLFDGMSCGQLAINRSCLKYSNYFASEIDKYAIQVTKNNYPNTIHIGSVTEVKTDELPKIDLLIGGSPCQSFSFAGNRKGMATKDNIKILTLAHYLELKNGGFEFEGQSYLFWEYVRILNEVKPKYFLLENVVMLKEWENIITKTLGVKPIKINSALVSAQNRNRLYWTNIGLEKSGLFGDLETIIKQPKDKGILLKDILETKVDKKYFLSDKTINKINRTNNGKKCFTVNDKSICLAAGYYKQGRDNQYIADFKGLDINKKARTLRVGGHGSANDKHNFDLIFVASRGRNKENPKSRVSGLSTEQFLEPRYDGKTNSLTTVQKDNLVSIMLGRSKNWGAPENAKGKHYTLCKEQPHGVKYQNKIRRLTPIECERLQTVPDNYTAVVSDTQRYKMLGNGWTIDVITHILNYIK